MRRSLVRTFILLGLTFQLTAGSGNGLPGGGVIGQVVLASQMSVGGVNLPEGGAILNDDMLRTAKGGKALVKFLPDIQVALAEETEVSFRSVGGNVVANLRSGIIVAQKQGTRTLLIETPKYRVEPKGEGRGICLVAVPPDQSTVVAARFSPVAITEKSSGHTYLLTEEKFAAIPASATGVPGSVPQEREESRQAPDKPAPRAPTRPPKPEWRIGSLSHGASVALVATVVAGGAAAAALPLALGKEAVPSPVQ